MKILRQVLGVLSLTLGLLLLGECAAHTARALVHFHPMGGSSALLLREAFFSPQHHVAGYGYLMAGGLVLLLLGTALTRAWALPFFAFALACLALFGGVVVERAVGTRGAEASLLQDGIAGIWGILGREDALMTLWMGVAALVCGLFVNHFAAHGFRRPGPAPAAGGNKGKAARGRDADPLSMTPAPAGGEAKVETSVDLDLSPDLETSEVHAPTPDPLSPPEEEPPAPVMQEEEPPAGDPPYVMEMETAPAPAPPPAEAPAPATPSAVRPPEPEEPEPSALLPAGGIILGLGALGASAASGLCPLEPATAGLVWAGGAAAGFGGLALALFGRPLKTLGWAAVGISLAGLAGAGGLLALGGG